MTTEISLIPHKFMDNYVLDQALTHLEKSIPYSKKRMTIEEVRKHILDGTHQLWVVFNGDEIIASMTTGISMYGENKFMTVHCCGGDRLLDWISDWMDIAEEWARDNECIAIELLGRKGWTPFMTGRGMSPMAVLFHKDLT